MSGLDLSPYLQLSREWVPANLGKILHGLRVLSGHTVTEIVAAIEAEAAGAASWARRDPDSGVYFVKLPKP